MEDQRLSVKEVADRVGISSATVRRYTDKYKDHLSSYAAQRPRRFTETDVARISTAYRLQGQHASPTEIANAIKSLKYGETLPSVDSPLALVKSSEVTALHPYIETQVHAAVAETQQTTLRTLVLGAVLGIAALTVALLLVGLAVWLFWTP